MITEDRLVKRIKKHVTGPKHSFYVITLPGLESLCLNELLALGISEASIKDSGIEFIGRIKDCYIANLKLRTATRILMRVYSFKATNFLQLEKKLKDFPWELFLYHNIKIDFKITCKKSRLYHTDAIGVIFGRIIFQRIVKEGLNLTDVRNPINIQQIFVRVIEDEFMISLDTSGEILYKRGLKSHGGKAPLRESTAAAILKLAGYTGKETLVDPMSGSGTFSLEAAMIAKNIPPGWYRTFSFMDWPSFKEKSWNFIKREAKNDFIHFDKPMIFASDNDDKACKALQSSIDLSDLKDVINVLNKNFFEFSPREFSEKTGIVVINPPYGLRIGTKTESEKLFHLIFKKLKKDYIGWKFGLIVPDMNMIKKLSLMSLRYKPFIYKLNHGGLKISLLTGEI